MVYLSVRCFPCVPGLFPFLFFGGFPRTPRPFRAVQPLGPGLLDTAAVAPEGRKGRTGSPRSRLAADPAPHPAPLRERVNSWERAQAPTIHQRPPLCHLPTCAPFSCPLPRSPLPRRRRDAPGSAGMPLLAAGGANPTSARASVALTAQRLRAAPSLCSPSSLGRALTVNNFIFLPKNSDVTTVSHRIPASRLHNRLCKIIIAR